MFPRSSIVPFIICMAFHCVTMHGDPLPPKDSGASFGSHHGLGFSDGVLYLHTGDTIYTVDLTDPNDPLFTSHMSGLRSTFGTGAARAFEGGFATAPGDAAMINMGFTDGGVLSVDLNAKTIVVVADFDADNVFSTAGRIDHTFYAMWSDPNLTTSTFLYHVAPNTLSTQQMVDPASGDASGGMAFESNGDLVAGTFDFINGDAKFYRISAADLATFESVGAVPTAMLLGSGSANGNVNVVVDRDGLVFFNTTTGIGLLDPSEPTVLNFYHDILDPNLFNYDGFKLPLNGLAYDELNHQLVFAEFNSGIDNYELAFLPIPEPTVAAILLAAGVVAFAAYRPVSSMR